jgi:hypothetical protein
MIGGASLIQGSHAVYYGFSALAWTQSGLDGAAIATLWALGVAAETDLLAKEVQQDMVQAILRRLAARSNAVSN